MSPVDPPDHLRLVITGSRHGRHDVALALDAWVRRHGPPLLVVVGDQKGVDTQAWEWAKKHDYPWVREKVRQGEWPECFYDRNQRMVNHGQRGDHLLAFPVQDSKGTWHCFARGKERGLVCAEVTRWWFERYPPQS
jgi:hypothetical protein